MWGSIVGAIGGLAGGLLTNYSRKKGNEANIAWARESQLNDQKFQREVFQNQYQWKADDARKAGLHPLAIIGGGSYSASPTSQPVNVQSSDYSFLGKMGENIGDAFTAYMTKDEVAKQAAKADQRADEQHDANIRESAARTLMYNGQALEATRRAASYSVPMASGLETIPGQVDANPSPYMESVNKYAWPRYPDGGRGDPVPSDKLSEAYENAPGIFAYTPYIDAAYDKWRSIFTGEPIDGYYHDWRDNRWYRRKPPKNPLRFWD